MFREAVFRTLIKDVLSPTLSHFFAERYRFMHLPLLSSAERFFYYYHHKQCTTDKNMSRYAQPTGSSSLEQCQHDPVPKSFLHLTINPESSFLFRVSGIDPKKYWKNFKSATEWKASWWILPNIAKFIDNLVKRKSVNKIQYDCLKYVL